jgi:uncharacterized damage-inducible protein DinB
VKSELASDKLQVAPMARRTARSESELREVLLETYAANDAMNQLLLAHVDPRVWRSSPEQENRREGRTIAGIFAHLHNNRLVWIKNSAPHLKCPAPLDPARCTIKQARAAHRQSAARCLEMLKEALSARTPRRVSKFSRGSWAPTWPAGATMFSYMFAHEAHHRGQAIMLARQLGYRLPDKAAYGIWRWEKLWKECGFDTPPR